MSTTKGTFRAAMLARSLTRRRSRVVIAVLAVAIGAATMFSLSTIAIDIPKHLALDIRSVGANLLVSPSETDTMSQQVVADVTAALPDGSVVARAGFRFETVRINQQPFIAAGTDMADAQSVKGYWSVDGDWPEHPGEVLLGTEVAEWVGLRVGDPLTLSYDDETLRLRLTGIADTGGNEDALVVLSMDDLETLTGSGAVVHLAEFSVALDATTLEAVAAAITAQVPYATAAVVQRLARSEADVLAMLRSLLSIISVVVLALTMIGVSTTMAAVVSERRTEIGLRKALGAGDAEVVAEFMGEALVLGALGGLLGVGTGYLLAQYVSQQVFARPVAFTPWLAAATFAAALLTTWGAGLLPVRKAATIDPAIVLREE
ncbi:MAG: ABC transporter permease [Propionibacteriaceae bacterium]|jgi:putative ABC transport system permease protein|nr:ABC transporter permease [Propionibacteriaceae bacterium]